MALWLRSFKLQLQSYLQALRGKAAAEEDSSETPGVALQLLPNAELGRRSRREELLQELR